MAPNAKAKWNNLSDKSAYDLATSAFFTNTRMATRVLDK